MHERWIQQIHILLSTLSACCVWFSPIAPMKEHKSHSDIGKTVLAACLTSCCEMTVQRKTVDNVCKHT
jgi:hypothetical protein